jgi:hypothetical protein
VTASRWRSALGFYVIVAYCLLLLVQVPFQFPPPSQLRLGPFVLEGKSVLVGIVAVVLVWAVMLGGLIARRPWGYRLALGILGSHAILVVIGFVSWLQGNGFEALRIMWQAVVWPSLQWFFTDALAVIYLLDRRDLFCPRGFGVSPSPNPRVQRTRPCASLRGSPLTRRPLGRHELIWAQVAARLAP